MLLAALGATIIGFVLLVVALMTANLWVAIACVVVSVIGVLLLLGDVLTYHRGDRDKKLAAEDRKRGWSPSRGRSDEDDPTDDADSTGSGDDDRTSARAAAAADTGDGAAEKDADADSGDVRSGAVADAERDAADADARREAGTVGHEEFGHHDRPGDDSPTGVMPLADIASADWSHESGADTDDQFRGLVAPGHYDPDMTDQIPQIEIERAWGSEWKPATEPGPKQLESKKDSGESGDTGEK